MGVVAVLWPINESADTMLDCWKVSNEFMLIAQLMAIWLSSKIGRYKLLPALYPTTYSVMPRAKQDKAIGNLLKSVGRLVVLAVMTPLWLDFGFNQGIVMGSRTGEWCNNHHHATSRRLFYGSKNMLLALMMCELGFLQTLSW